MDTLENLRLRAMALRSTVHNEHQLSAIELCAMVSKKTNEIIDVINDLTKRMEEYEKAFDNLGINFVYDEETETLRLEVKKNG